MTQQVRTAYRKHRRGTWGGALLAVVLIAAIAIPIASSAPDKTYTLLYPASGAVTPAPPVAGTTATQTLCAGDAYTVKLTLTNTAKTVSLGSANITFPSARATLTGSVSSTAGTASRSANVVSLRDLSLPKNGTATVTVSLAAGTVGNSAITAVVKQSNDFNDTGGDANVFTDATFPTLAVQSCDGTITGTIFNDRNENGSPDAASFETRQDWSVTLYRKSGSSYDSVASTTANASGVYTFTTAVNRDYVVCETAPSGSWIQTVPTSTPAPCATNGHEPNGWEFTFTQSVSGKDFGNVATTLVVCGGAASGNTEYTVQAGTDEDANCKSGQTPIDYIYEKWTDGGFQFAAFHPATSAAACSLTSTTPKTCTYFVMKVIWDFATSQQPDPANRSLKYDDVKGASGYSFEPMVYCKIDPRTGSASGLDLNPLGTPAQVAANVLPSGSRVDGDPHSSCLITSTESVNATGGVKRVDYVFSAVDGRMSMP